MTLEYGVVYNPNPRSSEPVSNSPAPESLVAPKAIEEYLRAQAEYSFPNNPETVAVISKHAAEIAEAIAATFTILSDRLDVPLSPPFNFDFLLLAEHTQAQSDDTRIVFDLAQLATYAQLMEKNTELGIAWITSLVAHEFYHHSQRKRFPRLTEKYADFLSSSAATQTAYRRSRVEQAAELFSAKYLLESTVQDQGTAQSAETVAARTFVAKQIKKELQKVLFWSRLKQSFTQRLLGKVRAPLDRL